jgi:hypothetical protein
MTIKELQDTLQLCLDEGITPDTQVKFRNKCNQNAYRAYSVDYILTQQEKDALLLCYDDGMY